MVKRIVIFFFVLAAACPIFFLAGCSSPYQSGTTEIQVENENESNVDSIIKNFSALESAAVEKEKFTGSYSGIIPKKELDKWKNNRNSILSNENGDLVPQFNYLAKGWLTPLSIPMDDMWQAFGFQERGMNYYSSGAPKDDATPYWERFNPASPFYQCWFGSYVISNFEFASEWDKPHLKPSDISKSAQRLVELAIADVFFWNYAYGAPTDATLIPGSIKIIAGKDGWFFVFTLMEAHSDMGALDPAYPWAGPYSLYEDLVEPYQPLIIEAVEMFKYDKANQKMLVIYSSGVNYKLKNGSVKNTPLSTFVDIARMMSNVTYK